MHSVTKVTPFELVYGKEIFLPMEVNLDALWISWQNKLSTVDYHNLMLDRLDEASDDRLKALGEIERDKLRKNHFRSKILFGKRVYLSGLKVISLGSCG
jgi:hypothetical protein